MSKQLTPLCLKVTNPPIGTSNPHMNMLVFFSLSFKKQGVKTAAAAVLHGLCTGLLLGWERRRGFI